ncbi:MAG: methylated-DNA--[protein]-cysteine S-methyltransferase [Acidimicrobiales bacterium]
MTTTTTTTITTAEVDTPVGRLCIAERDATVVACGFADHWDRIVAEVRSRFPDATWEAGDSASVRSLRAYVGGDLHALDRLAVEGGGTPFQQRVWHAIRTIPVGSTWSYTDLAAATGSGAATRAVGRANGANPVSVIVPCHRVIRSDGTLGGYGGGLDRKTWLLAHEGALLLG